MIALPRQRLFWSVSLGHLTNDTFMSMGAVLLTFLSVSVVPMTNTQIGFAVSAQQLAGAFSQPFFGLRADKTGGRGLGAHGVMWVVGMFMLALALALLTRSYILMLIPFVLQGLGSGAFHPVGSMHAAGKDRRQTATNLSLFFLAGQTGLALGPALMGLLLDANNVDLLAAFVEPLGLPGMAAYRASVLPIFVLALAVLPAFWLMLTTIPVLPRTSQQAAHTAERFDWRSLPLRPMAVLGLLIVLRGLAQPGSVNFIPALFHEKGWSPGEYGLITSSFWLAAGTAGVLFGILADRFDRRWIVMVTMVLSAPAFFFLPAADGVVAFLLAIAAGALSGGTHSLMVVLAQELVPRSKAFASGTILGFIFATGAVGSLLIGNLADQIGLAATFQVVALPAVISGVVGLLLPKARPD